MTNQLLYKIFIGLNDKDTKTQLITKARAKGYLNNCLNSNKIEGATMYEAQGLYTHQNGEVVKENCFVIELLFVDEITVKQLCEGLKTLLNQESIALQAIPLAVCELV